MTTQAAADSLSHRLFRQVMFGFVLLTALLVAIAGRDSGRAPAGFAPVQVSAVTNGGPPPAQHGPAVSLR